MRSLIAAVAICASSGFAAASDLPPVVKDGKIGYVLTHRLWTVRQTPGAKEECPTGLNLGAREQYAQLFPKDGPRRAAAETYLMREALQWLPTHENDPFPFKEATGTIVDGIDLDGRAKDTDFTSPDGRKGIDNQMFRAVGCIVNFRGPSLSPIWWYENEFVRRYVANRFMIEITGVDSLVNDDDVTVNSYRGMDELLIDAIGDASGQVITPRGTQRIDERWGKMFQATWKGRIVDGTLITEPGDALIPAMARANSSAVILLKGLRFRLKLTPDRAEGVLAGYTDIETFQYYINSSWGTHTQSSGEMPTLSMFRAIQRLADGFPNPKTGEMTAISSALDVKFTQVYVVHSQPAAQSAPSHRVAAAAPRPSGSASNSLRSAERYRPPVPEIEAYRDEPRPPGFGVQHTDVDGSVFVDPRGMTLYRWPYVFLHAGEAGDRRDKPSKCTDAKSTETSGYMSIYHGGAILPDLDIRPSCLQAWPAVLAGPDAEPIGKWTIIERSDGRKQWAYDGFPVYTSALDKRPGQVNGGFAREITDGEPPPYRIPIGPAALHPPAFAVTTVATGRILLYDPLNVEPDHDMGAIPGVTGHVVYSLDTDRPNSSGCKAACLEEWAPVAAGQSARPSGEWGVIERAPGVRQWTFRAMPLYTHIRDKRRAIVGARGTSLYGSDAPGARVVYTQKWPEPPKEFTVQDSRIGQVLADKNGMTLYTYLCGDDAPDQLSCDHPTTTQAYRLAICGRGDAAMCNKLFPYVPAPKGAATDNLIWGTAWIDPQTGHYAKPDRPGALHVWTFRDRPIYTHGRDKKPGDANGDSWGEMNGYRNGFKAFWIRDDFFGAAD